MPSIKFIFKKLIHKKILYRIQSLRIKRHRKLMAELTLKEKFTKIYKDKSWGSDSNFNKFYSGSGSHTNDIVLPYVNTIKKLAIEKKIPRESALDLGCGDFSVGSQICDLFENYIACDIVDELIENNKKVYKNLNVKFQILDITNDNMPDVDIIFLRQVLQHLSNEDIYSVLARIKGKSSYLMVTEHLPGNDGFIPNLDKPTGSDIRLMNRSGVVLHEPPFNLNYLEKLITSEIPEADGIVKTVMYKIA